MVRSMRLSLCPVRIKQTGSSICTRFMIGRRMMLFMPPISSSISFLSDNPKRKASLRRSWSVSGTCLVGPMTIRRFPERTIP